MSAEIREWLDDRKSELDEFGAIGWTAGNNLLLTVEILLDEVERLNHDIHGTDDGEPNQEIHAKVAETLGIGE